ncbi:DUF2812 domain-containing protein [Geosporobacter ferrireducens]|uniref:DUF2812 domain-containing protein n=1 Tax=Geosporobacter ferrireducens TaxID=1424294 RepID=A0A1D8GIA5_9FIRM|nr:DUF2812 domain-containing protein [Geosporobacter ferrireducens]AOT70628.1 hypothetical protein Gferi_14240 [Geosporobacter ferrireducens]MTI57424.1 DUF2812 domain-containing protein [Geosporobacter ferrireducens]
MKKYKIFIDCNKEEEWLNQIAKQGYELVNVSWGYQFKETKPQDANIRIDHRTFKSSKDFTDYCTMFEDSGWKHIAGGKNSTTQYFKKISENGSEDIFSDASSKAERYKRLSRIWLMAAISYMPIIMALIFSNAIDVNAIVHPKLLYYTPGLWEKSGFQFWKAFIFETPFALMRGFLWFFILALVIMYIYFSLKAQYLYKVAQKEI